MAMGATSIRIQRERWPRLSSCLHAEYLFDFVALHACDPFDLCSKHAVKLVPTWRSHSVTNVWWMFLGGEHSFVIEK